MPLRWRSSRPRHRRTAIGKSSGHQKWPDHKVEEKPVEQRTTVDVDSDPVADSSDVIRIDG